MAVTRAPVRQQSYLTEYDKQMAQYLREMGGSIGANDFTREAMGNGGQFPVGTMTAKILSGVLARASDKRAMNREERGKDSYSRAFEIANAQDRGLNAMPGELGVDQSGNLDLLPTTALQTTDGVTNRQPYVFDDSPVDTSYNFAPNNEEMATRERIANQRAEAFANASPEAPLGVPYARQDVALTVGEPTGEDTTRIGRYLNGTLEQDVLPTNANKALSQALKGANVNEFQFDEYRQNKRIQDRTLELAEEERLKGLQPKISERSDVYDPEGNRYQAVKITSGNRTIFSLLQPDGTITGIPMPSDYTTTLPKELKIEKNVKVLDTETGKLVFATDSEINDITDKYVPIPEKSTQYNLCKSIKE